ncbi:MAG: hypothetical protein ACFFDI_09840 [Promethearchaeota archaeon]
MKWRSKMIIEGIAIIDRSGLTLISRFDLDFANVPYVHTPFLHPFPNASSIPSNSPDISCIKLMEKFIYYSTSGIMFVVIVSSKELNVKKVAIVINKIKDRFIETYRMFLKSGNPSHLQVFNKILNEILKEQGNFDPQFRWIPKSLSSQPFFQRLDPTSLTAFTSTTCPFCGVQSLVAGEDKETKMEHIFCANCENRLQ